MQRVPYRQILDLLKLCYETERSHCTLTSTGTRVSTCMWNTDFLSKLVSYLTGITSLSRMQGSTIYFTPCYIHYLWSDSSCSCTVLKHRGLSVCGSVCVPSTHPAVGPCSVEAHNSQRSGSPQDYLGRSVPPSPAARRSSLKWQRTETGQRHSHANRLHHLQHLMDKKLLPSSLAN